VILEKIPQRIAWIIAEAAKEELCPISTNPISPITASVTTCFHVFETEAINEWIARNPVTPCPVCRKVCMATPAYSDSA
jgi:SUMO ligase MMS21 Smc5/6 complex component